MLLLLCGLATASPTYGADVETDPVNWFLGGHSLHVGALVDRTRLGLGTASLQEPPLFTGRDDIALYQSFRSLSLEASFGPKQRGFYLGGVGTLVRTELVHPDSQRAAIARSGQVGAVTGGRIPIAGGFFVNPRLSATIAVGSSELRAGSATWEAPLFFVLPVIELGWLIKSPVPSG